MPRPGWYRDPERTSPVRWWDGERWTAWQADSAEAPYPPPGPVETVAARQSPVARRVLLGGAAVGAVAAGLTATGLVLDSRNREAALLAAKPSSLGSIGPAAQEGSPLVVDPGNRVIRWSRLFSAELPPSPFEFQTLSTAALFTSFVAALQTKDVGWTNQASWWPSAVTVAIPKPALVDPTSLSATAGALASELRGRVGKASGKQDAITIEPEDRFPGRAAQRAVAVARYDDDRGKVITARIRVTVVQIHPMAHLAWFELLHERSTQQTAEALAKAYESIWVA